MGAPLGYPPQNYWTPPMPQASAWGPPGGGYPPNPADMYGSPPADMFGPAPQGGAPGGQGGMSPQEMAQLMSLAQSMGIPPEALGLPGGGGEMPGMPGSAGPQPVRGLVMKPDPNNPNSPGTVWDTGSGGGMGFFTKLLIAGLFIGGGVLAFKKWGNAEMVGKATTFLKDHTPQKLKDLYQSAAKKISGIFGKAEKAAEKAAT